MELVSIGTLDSSFSGLAACCLAMQGEEEEEEEEEA
jgi:hypothetical protein